MEHFKKALQYVKDNVEKIDVDFAIYHMGESNCPLSMVGNGLDSEIRDLMEEYGDEHDLPEGWWESECDLDEIVYKLYDLYDDVKKKKELYDEICKVMTWYEHPEEYPFGEDDFNRNIAAEMYKTLLKVLNIHYYDL